MKIRVKMEKAPPQKMKRLTNQFKPLSVNADSFLEFRWLASITWQDSSIKVFDLVLSADVPHTNYSIMEQGNGTCYFQ